MHAMWGRWAPPKERTRLTAITYSGQIQSSKLHTYITVTASTSMFVVAGPYVGNVLSFPLSAMLCQYGFDGGWPSVFYVFGKPQKSLSMADYLSTLGFNYHQLPGCSRIQISYCSFILIDSLFLSLRMCGCNLVHILGPTGPQHTC